MHARDSARRTSFLALSPDEAERRVLAAGGRAFHARIVRQALLEAGTLDYERMTSLPRELRARLARELPLIAASEVARSHAPDGTIKLLLGFDGGANVEMVHMPSRRAERGATICISTQVGCPVGCPFCASGVGGLVRNLEAHEIAEQMLIGRSLGPVSRCVVMGMGEPLLNAANLLAALSLVREGMSLGARRVTVSTVGFPRLLARLAPQRPPFQLAISLHSPFDEERARLVPAMADVPVAHLLAAGDAWFDETGREVTYEVCLLGGLNDTPRHAKGLVERLRGRRATVNLIPYNPVPGETYRRPETAAVHAVRAALEDSGLVATVRWSRGVEADAACGQLRARTASA